MTPPRLQMLPLIPGRFEPAVGGKIDPIPVGGLSKGQSIHDLNQHRSAVVLLVQRVELSQRIDRPRVSEAVQQDHKIEVVANRVSCRKQPRLDPRHLGQCRDAEPIHDLVRKRLLSPQLANPRLDAIEIPQNHDRPLKPLGSPTCGGFQARQDFVEPLAKVDEDVIPVKALPVGRMNGRSRPAHQNGAWDKRLHVAFRSQQSFPVGEILAHASSLFPG